MNENENVNQEAPAQDAAAKDESFADMLDAYEGDMKANVRVGDKIAGKIIDIGADTVFVDTGTKIDGAVEKTELVNDEGELELAVGDTVELYVVAIGGEGVKLSKAITGVGGAEMLREAFENRIPVEGKVTGTCKGGFDVEVLHRRAFCPVSQIDARFVENPEEYVNQTLQFYITTFERDGKNIVLSRRKLLDEQQQASQRDFLDTVKEGDEVEGKVTRLESFGAFVELAPGLEGMVHISELGWARIDEPSAAVQPGDTVTAKVLAVEPGKKPGQMRISLSMKQVMADPWDSVAEQFQEDQIVSGKVVRLAPFGAFVEIAPGIDGLVHVSKMSYKQRVHKPEDVVEPGQQVDVKIVEIDVENRRLSLSLRDAEGDPWAEAATKFPAGSTVAGTVEKREEFGLFINLEPGITGLMPKSLMVKAPAGAGLEKLKPGDQVQVVVQNVDQAQRRMSLAPVGAEIGREDNDDWKKYAAPKKQSGKGSSGKGGGSSQSSGDGGFGTLGDALQDALKKK